MKVKMKILNPFRALFLCIVSIATISSHALTDESFAELILEIEKFINVSTSNTWPINNNDYFSSEDAPPIDFGRFDFIIVGGGTAGGILANRLSEQKNFSILVVEAGEARAAISDILGLSSYLAASDWNWGYNTSQQTHGCLGSNDQRCSFTRGKGLGGCSTINEGFIARGHPRDFEQWAELWNFGWSYEDCLPYFKKSERAEFKVDPIDAPLRGFNGAQSVNIPEDTPILTDTLINAFKELGNPYVDYNGANLYGVSRPQFYMDYNTRASTAHSYINPILNRKNLNISLDSLVTKILISNKTANGIEFWKNGTKYKASARKEVILSAGAVNSPQLLMLSGIGPEEELQKHGIGSIAELPVGENFQDHISFQGIFFRTNNSWYNNTLLENLELWRENHRPLNSGYSMQTVVYYNTEGDNTMPPDIEIIVIGPPGASKDSGTFLNYNEEYRESLYILESSSDLIMSFMLMHPQTTGKITLKSNSPRDYPLINLDYYGNPGDLEVMYKGIQYALQLKKTEAFQSLGAYQIFPSAPDCDPYYERLSKDWLICVVKYTSTAGLHALGSTSMGRDPRKSVVDPKLKVHGFKKLRVVDAGVIPNQTSGHINVFVAMVAEKAADIIKSAYN